MVAGIMLLFGGLMVLLGGFTQLGALLLILFLLPTLVFFHDFWNATKFADEMAVRMQTIQWQKNLAMVGGLLVLLAAGPGSLSLDRMFRRTK
jgi:putative oxidoreductase